MKGCTNQVYWSCSKSKTHWYKPAFSLTVCTSCRISFSRFRGKVLKNSSCFLGFFCESPTISRKLQLKKIVHKRPPPSPSTYAVQIQNNKSGAKSRRSMYSEDESKLIGRKFTQHDLLDFPLHLSLNSNPGRRIERKEVIAVLLKPLIMIENWPDK